MKKSRLPSCSVISINSPLWQRAPARDEHGTPYIDFMMLIPGLNKECESTLEGYLVKINNCLKSFDQVVVYVDLNIKLNLLWISLKPEQGVSSQIVLSIQAEIPHAKVIATDFNPQNSHPDRAFNLRFRQWAQSWKKSFQKKLGVLEEKLRLK